MFPKQSHMVTVEEVHRCFKADGSQPVVWGPTVVLEGIPDAVRS